MTLSLDSLLMPYSDPAATQQRRYLPQDLSQGLTQDAGTLLGAPTTVPGFPSSAMPQTAQSPIPAPGTMDQVGQQLDQRLGELNTQTQGAQPPPLSNPLENLLAPSLMGQMGQTGTMPGMPTTPGAGLPTAGGAGVTGQDVPSTGYTGPGSVPGHYNYGGTDPLYNGNPGSYTQYGLNPKDLETIAGGRAGSRARDPGAGALRRAGGGRSGVAFRCYPADHSQRP